MDVRASLAAGLAIPALPLALDGRRGIDARRQRALLRYYAAAGAGGIAVGVHTTQFAIRGAGLYEPLLELAAGEMARLDAGRDRPRVRVAGICGRTAAAVGEAEMARREGFHAGLLSLADLAAEPEDALVAHARAVGEVLPVIGFYLQPDVGGRVLPGSFWRQLAGLPSLVAVKVAPFNRYRTLEVVRALVDTGRDDVVIYTGNDDHIVLDLLTPFRFAAAGRTVERRMTGGLLGHWAVWTSRAVELHAACRAAAATGAVPADLLARANEVTDMNAAVFDAANGFRGCIAGIHEVLRRQGLLDSIRCLDPAETLGPGQAAELDRVTTAYPHLVDDDFVAAGRDGWLAG